jgi:putative glutamine amidotransferase
MILLSYPCFFDEFQNKFKERLYLADSSKLEEQTKNSKLVIFTGGSDINPQRYGEKADNSYYDSDRDEMEYELLSMALSLKKPILGTCRGLQLLNVFFGGTLYQNITWGHNNREFEWQSRILESLFPRTNSLHHQGIKDLAENFLPIGNTFDRLTEAIFDPRQLILAFQFHPELITSPFWEKMNNPIQFYNELEDDL